MVTRHNREALCLIFCDLQEIITSMKWKIFSSLSWQWYEFCLFIEIMVVALSLLMFSPKSTSSNIADDVLFCALYLKIPQYKMKLPCAGS